MLAYHLGLTIFAHQLTGEGAKIFGGRWNLIGTPCLYACESKSLCVLEFAANVLGDEVIEDLSFTTYEIPNESWISFSPRDLPPNWKSIPFSFDTQQWGTKQLQNNFAIRIPSVIIPTEFNFVLNPLHPNFKKVHIKEVERFTFDKRIKK